MHSNNTKNTKYDHQRIVLFIMALVILTALLLMMKLAPNAPWPSTPWWVALSPVLLPPIIGFIIISVKLIQAIVHLVQAIENKDR